MLPSIQVNICKIYMYMFCKGFKQVDTCAWYRRSFLIFPVVKFQTSTNPSTEPVTRNCPSGENRAHSMWAFCPNWQKQQKFHFLILLKLIHFEGFTYNEVHMHCLIPKLVGLILDHTKIILIFIMLKRLWFQIPRRLFLE